MGTQAYRVYIIRNPSGRLYIGLSENVTERLADHNTGVSKWTKNRGPWELIWSSDDQNLSSALEIGKAAEAAKGRQEPIQNDRSLAPQGRISANQMRRAEHKNPCAVPKAFYIASGF